MSRLRENELFNHLNDKVRIGNMYIIVRVHFSQQMRACRFLLVIFFVYVQ